MDNPGTASPPGFGTGDEQFHQLRDSQVTQETQPSQRAQHSSVNVFNFDASTKPAIASNSTLSELFLNSNKFKSGDARALGELVAHSNLSVLDISWNTLDADSAEIIVVGLENNCSLKKLSLRGCGMGSKAARALVRLLPGNDVLRELDLAHNKGILPGIASQLADVVVSRGFQNFSGIPIKEMLSVKGSATSIDLRAAGMGPLEAYILAACIAKSSCVKNVEFGGNKFPQQAAIRLANAVMKCRTLETFCGIPVAKLKSNHQDVGQVEYRGHRLGETELDLLLQLLQISTTVSTFIFVDCALGDQGCSKLASSLRTNKHLTYLNLSNNGIGDIGFSALSQSLKVNQNLVHDRSW